MTGAPQPLVMAVFWTGDTEFVAGVGGTQELALQALTENAELDLQWREGLKLKPDRVDYLPLVPRASGWSTATEN